MWLLTTGHAIAGTHVPVLQSLVVFQSEFGDRPVGTMYPGGRWAGPSVRAVSTAALPPSSSPGSGLKEGPEPTKKGPIGGSRAHPGLGPPGSAHTQGHGTIPPPPHSWQHTLGLQSPSGKTQWGPQAYLWELLGGALQVSRKPGAPPPRGSSHSYTTSADPRTDPGPCVQMDQYQMGPQNHRFLLFLS